MPLNLAEKQEIVDEMHGVASAALSTAVVDYRGLSVIDFTQLRKQGREAGVQLRVVRNTLARRAFKDTEAECLDESLTGPSLFAFSNEDPGACARLFRDFQKDYPDIKVKALAVGGVRYEADDLLKVASLPTKEEAIAQLLSVMKAPIGKLVQTLHAVPTKLVRTIVAIKESKESATSDS